MSVVGDKIDGMVARATSPDKGLTISVSGVGDVAAEFAPGRYQHYSGPAMEAQLARTARLAWVGYQRGFRAVIDSVAGRPMHDADHDGPHRRLDQFQRQVVVTGGSASGPVWVRSVGLLEWRFQVPSRPAQTVPESQFRDALGSALRAVVADYRRQVEPAHADLFDLDLPPGMLDRLRGTSRRRG